MIAFASFREMPSDLAERRRALSVDRREVHRLADVPLLGRHGLRSDVEDPARGESVHVDVLGEGAA